MNPAEGGTSLSDSKFQEDVKALVQACQRLHDDPQSVKCVETLIYKLKQLHAEERQKLVFNRLNSETRRKLDSLNNLIRYLESQVERARRVASRRGLKYYLAKISNTVLGDEMERIAHSIESEVQSWLDQHDIGQLGKLLCNGSEDAKVKAISDFEAFARKGYDPQLQETILSSGLVEILASLLEPNAATLRVQREAASALSTVVHFNKDIFVGLMLMAGLVEKLLNMLSFGSEDLSLVAVCTLSSLTFAGKGAIVDEIQSKGGVKKLIDLLDGKSRPLQRAAMDCIFEIAYYGRREVVETMLEQGVMKKLAWLQCSVDDGLEQIDLVDSKGNAVGSQDSNSDKMEADSIVIPVQGNMQKNPFANAVSRFALQLGVSAGLRKREKRALKQEILRRVKDVMPDDAEVADVTAEVLWAP
eukprot:c28654_g1_i1 orf=1113-2363(+)